MIKPKDYSDICPGSNGDSKIRVFVAHDLIACASRRNNVLMAEIYEKEGHYTLTDVNAYYGSFVKACTELRIMNPDNIEDYEMIAANIRDVFEYCGHRISPELYKEYGVYDYDNIEAYWGFDNILIKEKLKENIVVKKKPAAEKPAAQAAYPVYPIKRSPVPVAIRLIHTYYKRFFGGKSS